MKKMNRNKHIDSAKGLLIFLVVFGHLIEPLRANAGINHVYKFIYVFHMPAFVFIAGMLSKATISKSDASKMIGNIAVPLIAFTLIYEGMHILETGSVSGYMKSLAPNWILWFLLSLLFWRLITPPLMLIRWPLVFSIAIAIGALSANGTGYYLSLARTFSFLPFFILGHAHGKEIFNLIGSYRGAPLIVAAAAVLLGVGLISTNFETSLLYGGSSFKNMGFSFALGAQKRIFLYLVSFSALVSVFVLTPRTDILAGWGRQSLIVYVWHGLAVKAIYKHSGAAALAPNTFGAISVCVIISVTIVIMLSTEPAHKITAFIFAPFRRLIASNEPRPESGAASVRMPQ